MPESPTPESIPFSCVHCAMDLTVPLSQAGISGPCPGCGEMIQSPIPPRAQAVGEKAVSPSQVAKPILPKPRAIPGRAPVKTSSPKTKSGEGESQAHAVVGFQAKAISPTTGLSHRYEERRERGAIIRFLLAVLMVLAVVVTVFVLMSGN